MATEPTGEPRPRRLGAWPHDERAIPRRISPASCTSSTPERSGASLSTSGAQRADTQIDVTIRFPERPIADASEQLVNRELVAAALGRLTQEHRDVLQECYFRGSSVAKAALALEITPDMVKSRAYYALRALRLAIEELGGVQ